MILAVTVFCPESMGGGKCEDTAQAVANVLRQNRLQCSQEHCQYDGKGDRFSVRILATWTAETEKLPYSISSGGKPVRNVVNFSSQQHISVTPIPESGSDALTALQVQPQLWQFTLEQLLPPDTQEEEQSQGAFSILVRRGTIGEHFTDCQWTLCQRIDTPQGLRLIRSAIALTRSVIHYQ